MAELPGGRTNRSFLLDADGSKLVMRLNTPTDILPGVDRAREIHIWRAASLAGLAPSVLHADHRAGLLITEFVDGKAFDGADIDSVLLDRLIELLARVHLLDVEAPAIDYVYHIENFWRLIDAGNNAIASPLQEQRRSMHLLVSEFCSAAGEFGLCHHDPVRSNVIDRGDRLFLLDWEYAARGPVVMDYAALCVEWNIDLAEITQRVALDPQLVETAEKIYRYICRLYAEAKTTSH